MNTPVNFELAKLLSKKGYNEPTLDAYVYRGIEHQDSSYKGILTKDKLICDISAPTIADVVMWLYEKHKIWLSVKWEDNAYRCTIQSTTSRYRNVYNILPNFSSPTKAYEAALLYTFKKLIP